LPWVALAYPELDWNWLVQQAKLFDLQNRLGFVVAMARTAAARRSNEPARAALAAVEQRLDHARLAREDTLCRESMPPSERRWLETARPEQARHWNLLTGLTAEGERQLAIERLTSADRAARRLGARPLATAAAEELARLAGFTRLHDLGVPENDLDELAAAIAARPGARANPRPS